MGFDEHRDLTCANVTTWEDEERGERCIADYFQQYLDALGINGEFYRR